MEVSTKRGHAKPDERQGSKAINHNIFGGTSSEVRSMTYDHETLKNNDKSDHTIYRGMDHRLRVDNEECNEKRGGLVTEHLCVGGQKKHYCWTNFMWYENELFYVYLSHYFYNKAWSNYYMNCSFLAQINTE
eukprot:1116102-Heterocapsa_arctica.AAC.1